MSLTSVFGMGTGGPSSQSIPTRMDGCLPIIYVKTLVQVLTAFVYLLVLFQPIGISRLRDMELCIMCEELVTRTGFEPMLKA